MTIDKPLANQIGDLRSLWKEAFGDTDAFLDLFFSTAFSVQRCRCISVDDKVVAALYWFDCFHEGKKLAYIYAVATRLSYRGKGMCNALMKDTHSYLKLHGYEGAILVPGSDRLFQFYDKIGYQICSHIREFSCTANTPKLSLCPVNQLEYAQLRTQYLPAGSVIQEEENLIFLEAQARFYVGEDFLLVASSRENHLFGLELLGNISAAPQILGTLGYKKGTFRVPGNERPFAMYYPLTETGTAPKYFAFAFD